MGGGKALPDSFHYSNGNAVPGLLVELGVRLEG